MRRAVLCVDLFSSIAPLLLSAVLKADRPTVISADSSTPKEWPAHPWTKHTHTHSLLWGTYTRLDWQHPAIWITSAGEGEQSNLQTLRGERNSCWTLRRVDVSLWNLPSWSINFRFHKHFLKDPMQSKLEFVCVRSEVIYMLVHF